MFLGDVRGHAQFVCRHFHINQPVFPLSNISWAHLHVALCDPPLSWLVKCVVWPKETIKKAKIRSDSDLSCLEIVMVMIILIEDRLSRYYCSNTCSVYVST